MDCLDARWGHSANEYGERFWSLNNDGRYTVAFYAPTAVLLNSHNLSPNESPDGLDDAITELPTPGPICPSASNEENFAIQLKSFANALIRRFPLQKEILSYEQLIYLYNKDLARRNNMSSYVQRVASFLSKTDKQDRYVFNSQSVQRLADAGFFNYMRDTVLGSKPPLLICFACGFEVGGMTRLPIEEHLKSVHSDCTFNKGYKLRSELQEVPIKQESSHAIPVQQAQGKPSNWIHDRTAYQLILDTDGDSRNSDQALHLQLTRLQR